MDASAEIIIAKPRRDVSRFMMDPRNDPLWGSAIVSVRPLTPGPLGPGSKVEQVSKAWGWRTCVVYEVTSISPEAHLELHVPDPIDMWVLYELDDAPGGTLVRARTKAVLGGRFSRSLFSSLARWNLRRDLKRLKRYLERAP